MIGFGWALSHMPQVKRLVVLNTAAFPLPTAKPMPWQLSLGRDSYVGGWAIRRFNLFARGAAWLGTKRRLPAGVRRAYIAPYDGWANAISTLRFMQDIKSEEHTSELQSLMRISYAVFCLKTKKKRQNALRITT